jgi:two-component system CheB/CheR fusion protein
MTVHPFHDDVAGGDVMAVFFNEIVAGESTGEADAGRHADHSPVIAHLESELRRTKELLQSNIEQANVSTEELKASN